jgi:hypothetical protein
MGTGTAERISWKYFERYAGQHAWIFKRGKLKKTKTKQKKRGG